MLKSQMIKQTTESYTKQKVDTYGTHDYCTTVLVAELWTSCHENYVKIRFLSSYSNKVSKFWVFQICVYFFSGFFSSCGFTIIFVFYHSMETAKHIWETCGHLVAETGSWFILMEQHALKKNINECLNINIYSFLETSGGQSSNLNYMLFIFSTPVLIRHLWQLKTVF